MKKIKITYNDYGTIRAKIIYFNGLYSLATDIMNAGIQEFQFIKSEVIMDASASETIDNTI